MEELKRGVEGMSLHREPSLLVFVEIFAFVANDMIRRRRKYMR